MITLSDLISKAQTNISDKNMLIKEDDTIISIDDDSEVGIAIRALAAYFGKDDNRKAIRLQVRGDNIGYIMREELYDFVGTINKGEGVGSGDISQLTGYPRFPGLHIVEYLCPVDNCTYSRKELDLGKTKTIKCKIHSESVMVIQP